MRAPNTPCPCGSQRKYKKCCRRYHLGDPPPHAELLMRARYAAYASGELAFVLDTTHPDGPRAQPDRGVWLAEVRRFSQQTTFVALRVEHAEEDGDTARVRFHATLRQGERDASFGEESLFYRVDGRWLYFGGERV